MALSFPAFRMSFFVKTLAAALLAGAAAAAGLGWWAATPLSLPQTPLDVAIRPHSPLRSVVQQLVQGGVPIRALPFELLTRGLGLATRLKAGNYEFGNGVTSYQVLQKIARGDVNEYGVTIVEGWTFKQMRAEINASPALAHDSAGMTDLELLQAIGVPPSGAGSAEGLFFPDTYLFDKGASDLSLYRRAYRLGRQRLDDAWLHRDADLPYRTPYDALTMASLIEKETGRPEDRARVAAVFVNRLRIGMPLQTDPSVIYGLGDRYDGRLRRKDLQTDGPYNTYTRPGLPPTPIALPGAASLDAALHPADSRALYFVARGDGSSFFSDTLTEHNKAVDTYIRGRQP